MTDDLAMLVGAHRNAPAAALPQNVFVSRDAKAFVVCRVTDVNDRYARLDFMGGGHYSMPIKEYDTVFVERWRPARPEDLVAEAFEGYRPPANAPEDWQNNP